MNWIIYSMITMFSLGLMLLIFKYLTIIKVNPIILNLYVFGLTFIGFSIFAFTSRVSFHISKTVLFLLIIASILAVIGNYYNVKGIDVSPNPGYHLAIAMARFVLVAVLAVFLFKSDFNWINFIGILITLIGLVLVSL